MISWKNTTNCTRSRLYLFIKPGVPRHVSRHVIWRPKHPVMVQTEMAAALGFFGTNGPMRSSMGFSGWKTCWVRPIRCCCFERYQVSEDWSYFKRMRGEWSEAMSNFQFFLFWFARYLVVFSLTRDPIDTLESSAYIDLISVACGRKVGTGLTTPVGWLSLLQLTVLSRSAILLQSACTSAPSHIRGLSGKFADKCYFSRRNKEKN